MNKDTLKGKMHNLKGRAKEAAGSLTGNKKLQAEGTAERLAGAAEGKVGQAEERLDEEIKKEREEEAAIDDDFDSDTPTGRS
jgi:uncharacterized protein YjbJ (UPF0337 family)